MTGGIARRALVLWDIDGTLLRGGGIGQRALEAAFREVLGGAVDLTTVPFGGNTDPAIIAAGLALAGHPEGPEHDARITAIAAAYLRILTAEVARRSPFRRLPGVREVVERLAGAGVHQGLGTGNLEAAAWLKVEAVELRAHFAFGGFGSDARDRGELLRIGRDRGAAQLGVSSDDCRVVVIGDTPRDIAAARAIGAEVIAVATGGVSRASLAALGADLLLESFAAPEAVEAVAAFLG